MTQLETDLNFISSLADNPAMTATELKQEFDKAGNIIKNFINSTLEDEITSDIASALATAKTYAETYTTTAIGNINMSASNISYNHSTSSLSANDVQHAIDELKGLCNTINTSQASKVIYTDFAVTTITASRTLTKDQDLLATVSGTKTGYYPIGIVGCSCESITYMDMHAFQLTGKENGSATITYKVKNKDWQNSRGGTFKFDVLWVKIRGN